jgi:D-arabinose 1-dehydrogenase-like Zn-dependent alcohol dehydrogenase
MTPDTMRVAQVPRCGEAFEVVDREIPEPGPDEVRVAVEACGVCHSDTFTKEGSWPGIEYPRVPGHEIAGRVDAVGAGVDGWSVGDRVGVGWHGSHCFACEPCRRGSFIDCRREEVTGIHRDGGYAECVVAAEHALAEIPDGLAAIDAAPLLCAGLSTFNVLRKSAATLGDVAAIQGIGGLGHLGIQFAAAGGFETVAISRGTDKRDLAIELGADHYVDATASSPAEELLDLGGASVIVSTAPSTAAIESVLGGLGLDGELYPLGVPDEVFSVDVVDLIENQRSVHGHSSGTAAVARAVLAFGARKSIDPMIETFPLVEAGTAYRRMKAGDVEFRAVLAPDA